MTTFDDRLRGEEARYQHEQELGFKVRNRRNRLFGLWAARERLGLSGDAAEDYAKAVVLADFEAAGDSDMVSKVRADLAQAGKAADEHALQRRLDECEAEAKRQVMAE